MTGKTSRQRHPGYQPAEGSEPEPVGRLVADRAGNLPAQDCVLMPQHEQLGAIRGVTAQRHRRDGHQPPGHPVQQRHDHADMIPGPNCITPTCADDFSSGTGSRPPSTTRTAARAVGTVHLGPATRPWTSPRRPRAGVATARSPVRHLLLHYHGRGRPGDCVVQLAGRALPGRAVLGAQALGDTLLAMPSGDLRLGRLPRGSRT